MTMKIAIAQINVTVGDLAGNAAKVLDAARRAKTGGANLVLAPELALSGYPPEDLLLRDGFYQACDQVLQDLAGKVQGLTLVVGHPQAVGDRHFNA
ncbi:MAG: nitrilase-related carbon-nitrogen hydrolase, partial [Burkholderiales bacterium]